MSRLIRIGTRGSTLARWQASHVATLLRNAHPQMDTELVVISTHGDQVLDVPLATIGGKGAFTAEIEQALLNGSIDLAVHSLKDLPTTNPVGLIVGAIPSRGNVEDVLISRQGYTLATLPHGATVGTSSSRRGAQIQHLRPDITIANLRGNVDTRIQKAYADSSPYDAIILARAGVERIGKTDRITQILSTSHMLPAPAQGALAVQCAATAPIRDIITAIDDAPTRFCVTLERAFLAGLGSGCSLPVGAYASITADTATLEVKVLSHDGQFLIHDTTTCSVNANPTIHGADFAQHILDLGARDLLNHPIPPPPNEMQ